MKIFVTGSTGFVGKNLVNFYKDHTMFEHHRDQNIVASLNHFEPDVIINCAAEIYKADNMWVPNVLWVQDCLEYVKTHSTVQMIQIGSSAEYGPLSKPGAESDKINPVDMYQATKGAATLLCQGYARTYNLNISIARPYSLFGIYERPHRLFPRLYSAFFHNKPMDLFAGEHDFIYIDDFIRGIDILVQRKDKPLGDIVNFGSGTQTSNLEVLRLWQGITGREGPVTYTDKMAKNFESNVWVCDTSYARKNYGFETQFTLEQGIKDFIKKMEIL